VDPLRILTLTGLFPNSVEPRHGVFVAERLRQLTATGEVTARVTDPRFGRYANYARVPRAETIGGFEVAHPRWLAPPGAGIAHPFLLAAALAPAVAAACRGPGAAAVIDSHFLYPDGVAAWLLGRRFGIPTVLTARGSDVNVHARERVAGALLRRAIAGASRVVAVADSLRDALLGLGARPEQVVTLRNGVDLDRFRPVERGPARARLGLEGPTILCVGNLLPVKGHDLAIETVAGLAAATLLIAGEGPERARLETMASAAGLTDRVRLLGNRSQSELIDLYAAADVLLLPSLSEGMPNVVLEALACGLPVVATAVGGVPEILPDPAAGRVVPERNPAALRAALVAVLSDPPARTAVRALATGLGWGPTVAGLKQVLRTAAGRAAS
jgi:teichuronic acid biosynthesis glycosyltransferase TuaC